MNKIHLIMSIESVYPPISGIGRYTWELLSRLKYSEHLGELSYMRDGVWVNLPSKDDVEGRTIESSHQSISNPHPKAKTSFLKTMRHLIGKRSFWGRFQFIRNLHSCVTSWLMSRRLRKIKTGIFHGPNFYVPETHLKKVVTIHDLSIFRYPQWHPVARVEKMREDVPQSLSRADLILTVSEATRQDLIQEFNVDPRKVVATLLGVDDVYQAYDAATVTPTLSQYQLVYGEYALFVSTIEPRKNIENLLKAYAQLPDDLKMRYPLVLAGGVGWQNKAIHAQIDAASAEGWVKYLGFVDQAHLPALYAGCRLFAYPSWYEGFGLPIAEAMASGVPVLTSNCSSMPEVANGAALLVNPSDVNEICVLLEKGLTDEAWRAEAIQKGLQRASELTWEACAQKTIKAYQSLM